MKKTIDGIEKKKKIMYYIINGKKFNFVEYIKLLIDKNFIDNCKGKTKFERFFTFKHDLNSFANGFNHGLQNSIDIKEGNIKIIFE